MMYPTDAPGVETQPYGTQRLWEFLRRQYPVRYKTQVIAKILRFPVATVATSLHRLLTKDVVDHNADGWVLKEAPGTHDTNPFG